MKTKREALKKITRKKNKETQKKTTSRQELPRTKIHDSRSFLFRLQTNKKTQTKHDQPEEKNMKITLKKDECKSRQN